MSGYNVMVARSPQVIGPYIDQQGNSLLVARAGGTPVISANGNRWVGPGHNAVFTDFVNQDYFLYHAIDRGHPYFEGAPGFTKRPVMLDPLDWKDGWPVVRGGFGPSEEKMAAPAAQPEQTSTYVAQFRDDDQIGPLLSDYSDDFIGPELSKQWTWIDSRFAHSYFLTGSGFELTSQTGDLYESENDISLLAEAAPASDYAVETKVGFNVPSSGCCFNYAQAGLVIYENDDNYVKLVHSAVNDARQIVFAKEQGPVPDGYARFGAGFVGPPADATFLRIVCRHVPGGELYTGYSSTDGTTWIRSGTWTHTLGQQPRIGLVSMGYFGFTAEFDYVQVYQLPH